ncbi:MAG TPA: amidohydrolase family protein [Streptosporangiaceae bacterium]|nr:amidohydrolase family protein [Streptosporangiaceae bacterium]
MIVDAHHHVWDPAARRHAWLDASPALNRAFGLAGFERASEPERVTASVLVQVLASTAETEEFLALAAGPGPVAGVVGWTDLTSPAVADEIARLRALPGGSRLVGIRHLVQDEPDPGWLRRPEVCRGIRAVGAAGLAYDLLVRPPQLPAALAVTRELADVEFVLDHGAKPPIASGVLEPWASGLGELAARPNVSCKVSGLVTEAGPGWRPAQVVPYIDRLVDAFGPGRLMFGSDWPVCTLAASYAEVTALARDALAARLGPADLEAVFRANAIATYRLGDGRRRVTGGESEH